DDKTIGEAIAVVAQLRSRFPELDSAGLDLAAALEQKLAHPSDLAVTRTFIDRAEQALENQGKLRPKPGKVVKKAKKTKKAKKDAGKYTSPVFKCHGDYGVCLKKGNNSKICMALLAICIGRQLIPFVRKS